MIKYFLNGQECSPSNAGEIQYEFNFDENRDRNQLELTVSSLIFEREFYTRIQDWRLTYGDYVGMPLDIQYSDGTVIKYILDFTQDLVEKDRSIEVKIMRYKGWDHFFKRAEGLAFQSKNINWVSSDFRKVDYVVIPDDLITQFISLSIATFVLAKELQVSIINTVDATNAVIEASTPSVSAVGPVVNVGDIITASIKLAAVIAYTVAIIIALVKLITQIIELIFPKVRQYKGITYKKLIEKGVNHLGFQLESSLLNALPDMVVLPKPTKEINPSIFNEIFRPNTLAFTDGYPSASDTIPTLKLALDEFEKLTNSETRVENGTVKIEKREFFEQNASQELLTTFNLQDELQTESSINSSDQYKRLVAFYQTDPIDINTYDNTAGTISERSNEVINSPDPQLELIEGYTEIRLNFARGTRKNNLTWLEEAAKGLAKAVDLFTGGSASAKINSRKAVLQISSQYFTTTKLLYMEGSKLNQNQNKFIGTDAIIAAHASKSIVENQKNIVKNMPLAMTESEMFNILSNNFVTLKSGETIEVTGIRWSEDDYIADVDYKARKEPVNVKTIAL